MLNKTKPEAGIQKKGQILPSEVFFKNSQQKTIP